MRWGEDVLSFGEFLIDGTTILGPAVDEAAEYHEISDGAFIWMLPSATKMMIARIRRQIKSNFAEGIQCLYSMPTTQGKNIYVDVLNPFNWVREDEAIKPSNNLMATFKRSKSPTVAFKAINTMMFYKKQCRFQNFAKKFSY